MISLFKTILYARAKGLLYLKKADQPARLDCLGSECGKCCEVLGSGVLVTEAEAYTIGRQHVFPAEGRLFLKSEGTTCSLLKNKLCSCYDVRPKGCREYPWYSIDGRLFYDSGCPGMKFDRDERPEIKTIRDLDEYLPQNRFLKKLIKTLLRR